MPIFLADCSTFVISDHLLQSQHRIRSSACLLLLQFKLSPKPCHANLIIPTLRTRLTFFLSSLSNDMAFINLMTEMNRCLIASPR